MADIGFRNVFSMVPRALDVGEDDEGRGGVGTNLERVLLPRLLFSLPGLASIVFKNASNCCRSLPVFLCLPNLGLGEAEPSNLRTVDETEGALDDAAVAAAAARCNSILYSTVRFAECLATLDKILDA